MKFLGIFDLSKKEETDLQRMWKERDETNARMAKLVGEFETPHCRMTSVRYEVSPDSKDGGSRKAWCELCTKENTAHYCDRCDKNMRAPGGNFCETCKEESSF